MMTDSLILDFNETKSLVGDDEAMAKSILLMLSEALPVHQSSIQKALAEKNLEALRAEAHKLHGASCYTGTMRLKNASKELESAAKSGNLPLSEELEKKLEKEIQAVQEALKTIIHL